MMDSIQQQEEEEKDEGYTSGEGEGVTTKGEAGAGGGSNSPPGWRNKSSNPNLPTGWRAKPAIAASSPSNNAAAGEDRPIRRRIRRGRRSRIKHNLFDKCAGEAPARYMYMARNGSDRK